MKTKIPIIFLLRHWVLFLSVFYLGLFGIADRYCWPKYWSCEYLPRGSSTDIIVLTVWNRFIDCGCRYVNLDADVALSGDDLGESFFCVRPPSWWRGPVIGALGLDPYWSSDTNAPVALLLEPSTGERECLLVDPRTRKTFLFQALLGDGVLCSLDPLGAKVLKHVFGKTVVKIERTTSVYLEWTPHRE